MAREHDHIRIGIDTDNWIQSRTQYLRETKKIFISSWLSDELRDCHTHDSLYRKERRFVQTRERGSLVGRDVTLQIRLCLTKTTK